MFRCVLCSVFGIILYNVSVLAFFPSIPYSSNTGTISPSGYYIPPATINQQQNNQVEPNQASTNTQPIQGQQITASAAPNTQQVAINTLLTPGQQTTVNDQAAPSTQQVAVNTKPTPDQQSTASNLVQPNTQQVPAKTQPTQGPQSTGSNLVPPNTQQVSVNTQPIGQQSGNSLTIPNTQISSGNPTTLGAQPPLPPQITTSNPFATIAQLSSPDQANKFVSSNTLPDAGKTILFSLANIRVSPDLQNVYPVGILSMNELASSFNQKVTNEPQNNAAIPINQETTTVGTIKPQQTSVNVEPMVANTQQVQPSNSLGTTSNPAQPITQQVPVNPTTLNIPQQQVANNEIAPKNQETTPITQQTTSSTAVPPNQVTLSVPQVQATNIVGSAPSNTIQSPVNTASTSPTNAEQTLATNIIGTSTNQATTPSQQLSANTIVSPNPPISSTQLSPEVNPQQVATNPTTSNVPQIQNPNNVITTNQATSNTQSPPTTALPFVNSGVQKSSSPVTSNVQPSSPNSITIQVSPDTLSAPIPTAPVDTMTSTQNSQTTPTPNSTQQTITTTMVPSVAPIVAQPAVMSRTMWLAQMSTMERQYTVRYNDGPLPDRSIKASLSLNITCPDPNTATEIYRQLDGSCNNINNPTIGQSFRGFKRLIRPHYSDFYCSPRTKGKCTKVAGQSSCSQSYLPSARSISQAVHTNSNIKSNHTLLLNYWAQFVATDLSAAAVDQTISATPCCENVQAKQGLRHPDELNRCTGECFPIMINQIPADRRFTTKCMEYIRSRPVTTDSGIDRPREQVNIVTPYLDSSNVYGSDEATQAKLRAPNGMLKITANELLPPGRAEDCILTRSPYCFASGDDRVNHSPELALMHLAMVNLHNDIAEELIELGWNEEKIFQETKKIVNALIQKVTYTEFLPHILNAETLQKYNLNSGDYVYEENTDPRVANVFSTAAFQFIHSMTTNSVMFGRIRIPLRALFNNPALLHKDAELVAKEMIKAGEVVDRFFSTELTDHYFESGSTVFDLVAQIIQRGRDHGLPAYKWFRKECGLSIPQNFTMIPAGDILSTVYGHVDDIDVFVGGMIEDPLPGSLLGPTFSCLVARQFRDTKYGDSHWYETTDTKKGFTAGQLNSIKTMSAASVLCHGLDLDFIPKDPFKVTSATNRLQECGRLPEFNVRPWFVRQTPTNASKPGFNWNIIF